MRSTLKENSGHPTKITPRSHREMVKAGRGTYWSPSQKGESGKMSWDRYGPFDVYISADESVKIAHATLNGEDYYYDKMDNNVSEEEAARMLGVDSLEDFETNDVSDFLTNLSIENKINNKKQIKENEMSKKKVLRYTEKEFVNLLENIVNRVKKEQRLEESKKLSRKKRISENLERIRRERKNPRNKMVETRDYPISRDVSKHSDMQKYGRNTKWSPSGKSDNDRKLFDSYIEQYGPFKVYISGDDSIKIACNGGQCFDQNDRPVSKEEAAQMLGVDSLEQIGR